MDYDHFKRLIGLGEQDFLDYKEKCWAFAGKDDENEVARGELAKDICAMANNGEVTSYIIIGVSDDGRHFTSVTNDNLTDDNLQVFCKDAVSPAPKVRLHRASWPEAMGDHMGKTFVIIEVGPHPRPPFCLKRDFIIWKKQQCYRHNEVWIRRGATSDLAHPQEIAHLLNGEATVQDKPDLSMTLGYSDGRHAGSQGITVILPHVVVEPPDDERIEQWVAKAIHPIGYLNLPIAQEDLDEYRTDMRAYLHELYVYEEMRSRVFPLRALLHNRGTYPADNIELALEFPAGFTLTLDDERVIRDDVKPSPPKHPQPQALKSFSIFQSVLGSTYNLNVASLVAPRSEASKPEYFGPFLNESNTVRYACPTLLHDATWPYPSFPLQVPPEWMGRRIEVTCRIKARQQRETRIQVMNLEFTDEERIPLSTFFPDELSEALLDGS